MIDFTFAPEVDEVRFKVRSFIDTVVRARWEASIRTTVRGHGTLVFRHGGARGCRIGPNPDQDPCPRRTIAAWKDNGTTKAATGNLPL